MTYTELEQLKKETAQQAVEIRRLQRELEDTTGRLSALRAEFEVCFYINACIFCARVSIL